MIADGADILDIGGESTRPGAAAISLQEELQRVIPVVRALAGCGVPISVDSSKSIVASEALSAGATMLNDISAFHFDPAIAAVAAQAGVPVVIMHMKGTPRDMQQLVCYDNMLQEISDYLQQATSAGIAAGIPHDQLILDPGFGFAKGVVQNLEILRRLREFTATGQPLLLGTSRKSTISHLLGGLPPEERIEGTAATVALAIANGVDIVRVHDVKAMARVARVSDAVVRPQK